MKIYITGLPSGYEVEHLTRLFFPLAPLAGEPPALQEDAVLTSLENETLRAELRLDGQSHKMERPLPKDEKPDFALASLVYDLLRRETGIRPPWGKLTGVRPVRIIHDARDAGKREDEIAATFLEEYDCTPEKFSMARQIADLQQPILQGSHGRRDYSLYIGIPFCPSRCSYCSFVSCNLGRDKKLVQPYVEKLCEEVRAIRQQAEQNHLCLRTIYIGGGTPTSLSASQLRLLMETVKDTFELSKVDEYTVEAGRPDCTDAEKLAIIKELGATRISINPQTFSDEVLANIGRRHSAADIERCYHEARAAGHTDINMDLIAGLPGDTVEGFEKSLRRTISLEPENITVHTLTIKRASRIMMEGHAGEQHANVAAMLQKCSLLAEAGYRPYYLYRQKNTLQNLENVGWCKPGHEGIYNIYIMEEVHTILSAGAGGSTKLVQPGGSRIERIFNFKYPAEYVQRFDEVLERKKGVSEFYECCASTQAPCGNQPAERSAAE
jgi:oxygen-independent coproporphyrinogen-3 oxidase